MKRNRVLQIFAILTVLLALVVCVAALPRKTLLASDDDAPAEDSGEEFEVYPLAIGGEPVTSANAGDLTQLECVSGDEATYDAKDNTLTLKNVTIEAACDEPTLRCAIVYDGESPLTIKISGTTELTAYQKGISVGMGDFYKIEPPLVHENEVQGFADVDSDTAGLIIDIDDGSLLKIAVSTKLEDLSCHGICSSEDVIICGEGNFDIFLGCDNSYACAIGDDNKGKIDVTIENTSSADDRSMISVTGKTEDGIWGKNVVIDGAKINLIVASYGTLYALYSDTFTINNGILDVSAMWIADSEAKSDDIDSYVVYGSSGVDIVNSKVSISSAVSVYDKALSSNNYISITDKSVVEVESVAHKDSFAILVGTPSGGVSGFENYDGKYIEIVDSTVKATSASYIGTATAIESNGIISVSNSMLTVKAELFLTESSDDESGDERKAYGLWAMDYLEITDGSVVKATSETKEDDFSFAISLGFFQSEQVVREPEVKGFGDVEELGAIVISDSKVTANATSGVDGSAFAIFSKGDLSISLSQVEAKANVELDGQASQSGAIVASGSVSIDGKTTVVDAQAKSAMMSVGLTAEKITIGKVLGIEKPEDGEVISTENYVYVGVSSEEDPADEVLIKAPTVKVTIDPNNGDDPYEEEVIVGDPIDKPQDPTKEDHEFDGWYDDPDLTIPHDFDEPVEEGKSYTLYAKWKKVEKETEVTTEPTETTAAPDETTVAPDETTAAPDETTAAPTETTAAPTEPEITEPTEAKPTVEIKYIIVEGADSKYTKKSGKTIKIVVKRSDFDEECFQHFKTLKIGDKEFVIEKQYTAKSGSTILEIKPEALDELETGKLNVTIIFDDGQCETTLTIEPASLIPKTGEVSRSGIWMLLVTISAAAVVAIPVFNKKRQAQK
ncbi:MAG: InlB B-repeat-containing protein [Clostridiales bacterium]|nr:InlB B-repeat-containing protein [Clostridiales bacterium]